MNATNNGYDVDYQRKVFGGVPTAQYRMILSILHDNFLGVRHFVVEKVINTDMISLLEA